MVDYWRGRKYYQTGFKNPYREKRRKLAVERLRHNDRKVREIGVHPKYRNGVIKSPENYRHWEKLEKEWLQANPIPVGDEEAA